MRCSNPRLSEADLGIFVDTQFADWFKRSVRNQSPNDVNKYIRDLAEGPLLEVTTYQGYVVNGYRFHTVSHQSRRATMNSGVCIKGEVFSTDEMDFYGRLVEVCVLEYPAMPIKRITLFKCEWFDPSNSGTLVHNNFKLVSINHKRKYNKYEPFILANQAIQVFYCSYPSMNQAKKDWWEVCKVKARSKVELPIQIAPTSTIEPPFQEDEMCLTRMDMNLPIGDDTPILHPNGGLIDIDDDGFHSDEDFTFSDDEYIDVEDDD